MAPNQQTPPTNPQQKPTIDDLIAHTNHQEYTFQTTQANRSLKSWLSGLPRANKLLLIGGGAGLVFIVLMVSLSLHTGPKANLASTLKQTNGTSATTIGTDAASSTSGSSVTLADDTNGDGVVDDYDTSDTSSSAGVSWWQRIINTVNTKNTTTNSSGSEDDATSSNTASDNSSSDSSSSPSTASAVASQENTEENQEEEQVTVAPVAATTTPQTPTTPTTSLSPPVAPVKATPTLIGVTNFRDAATSTGFMKTGVLYRSAKLQNATSSDRIKLASLLKNGFIIDLRTKGTRTGAPDGAVSGVTNLSFPVNGASSPDGYVKEFVSNATDRAHFGDAITKIANTKGSVLVHCTAGKDRTGWTVAMVMYAIGANDKQVMDEYMKSKEFGAKVDPTWLNKGLKEARARNGGSIIKYIKSTSKGLGVTDATIQKLKTKLSAK